MKSRMTDRKMIRMSRLHTRINTSDMQGDWVTMGVIVQKSEPKMSSKVRHVELGLYDVP